MSYPLWTGQRPTHDIAENMLLLCIYEARAKSSRTCSITFITDMRLFSYFHKCNNGLLSIFM